MGTDEFSGRLMSCSDFLGLRPPGLVSQPGWVAQAKRGAVWSYGEPAGIRTQGHLIKSQVLYRLSYGLVQSAGTIGCVVGQVNEKLHTQGISCRITEKLTLAHDCLEGCCPANVWTATTFLRREALCVCLRAH